MKRKHWLVLLVAVLLLAAVITLCSNDTLQLRWALDRYQSVIEEMPEDLTLTIYYVPCTIVFRSRRTVEQLVTGDHTVKIVVPAEDLAKHVEALERLDAADVQPAAKKHNLNAHFYYVFSRGDQKILEVVMWDFFGDTEAFRAFVNGIPVEKNTVLYEIVLPFLSDEDRENLWLDKDAYGPNGELPFGAE